MLTMILRFILNFAHLVYAAVAFAKSRWAYVRRSAVNVWRKWQSKDENADIAAESSAVKRTVGRIEKLPRHLCVVVGFDETVNFHDLVRILGWSIAAGIPYVSFYDHDGYLKKHQKVFRTECEIKRPKLANRVDWGSQTSSKNNSQNGCAGLRPRTRVQIFSNEDGKGEIVRCAQWMSRAVADKLLTMDEINAEYIDAWLRREDSPDPDLALVCGPALCTNGLLPWHTRTTEFFNIRSHHNVCVDDFTFILEKFGKSEQRYGK